MIKSLENKVMPDFQREPSASTFENSSTRSEVADARDALPVITSAPIEHDPNVMLSEMVDVKQETQQDLLDGNVERERKMSSQFGAKCILCQRKCLQCCRPCMAAYNPLPSDASVCEKLKHSFMCPPHGKLAKLMALAIMILLVWGTLWGLSPDSGQALPGGTFFGVLVLLVLCVMGGAMTLLIRLPPLLGMLIVGCALRNIPGVKVIVTGIDSKWSSSLRTIALVVILLRAGLGLDPKALKKLSCVVVRLAFLPCIVECITVAVTTNLLMGFPWEWGFMLGFVLAAVSPAVVVPSLLSLQDRGYGTDQGIPTLVIAAASIDDVLAISGFGVVLGITFSTGDLALAIARGPLEALMGVTFGILYGIFLWYIPHRKHSNLVLFRTLLFLGGGLFVMFGSNAAGFPGAGALGVLTMAFVSAFRWRSEGWTNDESPVADVVGKLWILFQPLLFGLIGAEVDLTTLDGSTIGLGIATLFIGLVFRIITSFLAVFGAGLNWKEQFFIPIAWLPKATVQAAIGGVALDTARNQNSGPEAIQLGMKVLTIAVLVIIITAPIGAAAIALVGPRLLKLSKTKDAVPEVDIDKDDYEEEKRDEPDTITEV